MRNKKIITAILTIAVIHFLLTSIIGFYIGVQLGTQMGQIVSGGLTGASDKNPDKSEEEANRIYQNMKSKRDDILARWKLPLLLISLPAKPLMNPLLNEIGKKQLNKVISQEVTKEQFQMRVNIIHYTANFLNSLSFGLLVYIMLRIFNQYRRKR